jgi:hypothetical protein
MSPTLGVEARRGMVFTELVGERSQAEWRIRDDVGENTRAR